MKEYLKTGLLITFSFIVFSCTQNKTKPESVSVSIVEETPSKLSLCLDGTLYFRRSFADVQFMDDEKEISKYLEEQERNDPLLVEGEKDPLIKHFEKIGLVRDRKIILSRFEYRSETKFDYPDDQNIHFRFANGSFYGNDSKLIGYCGTDSAEVETPFKMKLKYAILDIIPGGNKEIVVLDEIYFMNGYNFDFSVYEITIPKKSL